MGQYDIFVIGAIAVIGGWYVITHPEFLGGLFPPAGCPAGQTKDASGACVGDDLNPPPTDGNGNGNGDGKDGGGNGNGGGGDGGYDCKKACRNCWCRSYSEKCSGSCSRCCGGSRIASKCGGKGVKSCGGGGGGGGGSGDGGGGGFALAAYQDPGANRITVS